MRFTKYDGRKARLDLLPPRALEFLGHVLGHGARKYEPGNWVKCDDPSRYVAAVMRHALKHLDREFTDADSGLPHLAHAAVSALFALDLYLRGVEDRTVSAIYFAVVKRTGPSAGVIEKRFKSFEAAWRWHENRELPFERYTIKTVGAADRIGMRTVLPLQKMRRVA